MAALTVVQGEDESKTMTASAAPEFGSTLVWTMIDRLTKEAVFTKDIAESKISDTSVTLDIADTDTTLYHGMYYYELWQHGTIYKLLDSGTVLITATYAGDIT